MNAQLGQHLRGKLAGIGAIGIGHHAFLPVFSFDGVHYVIIIRRRSTLETVHLDDLELLRLELQGWHTAFNMSRL